MPKVLSLKDDIQVVKANSIIEAKYKLTQIEQKLILIIASMIHQEDDNLKFYRMNAKDLLRVLDIDKSKYGSAYEKLKQAIFRIRKRGLAILKPDGGYLVINWVASAEYYPKEGIIEFEFSSKLKPYLLQLKKSFTAYRLKNVVQLKSSYSIRIYELLKQYEKIGRRKFELEDLQGKLGVVVWDDENKNIIERKYPKYNDFKRKVIEVALKELPEKSDIAFDYREIKTGRKVTSLEFYNIRHNIPPDANFGQLSLDFPVEVLDSKNPSKTSQSSNFEELKGSLRSRGVSPKQIDEIIRKFGNLHRVWNFERYPMIEFYCEYYDWQLKQPKNKPESGAWIYKAITDQWSPPQIFKTKKEIELAQEKINEQAKLKEEAKKREDEKIQKDEYKEWLTLTPAERWKYELFEFRRLFRKKHDRKPTNNEVIEAEKDYLANPETPEEYQKRLYGEVKYPTTIEEMEQ